MNKLPRNVKPNRLLKALLKVGLEEYKGKSVESIYKEAKKFNKNKKV